jgi:ParB family chromosome partitioning protein
VDLLTEFIQISQIDSSPFEARASITPIETADRLGVISPIIVRKKADGRYEVVAGHRRLQGLKATGKTEAPCEIVEMDDERAALALFADNEDRQAWEGYEKGKYFRKMMETFHLDQTQVAAKCGVSKQLVSLCLGQAALTDRLAQALKSKEAVSKRLDTGTNFEVLKLAISGTRFEALKKLPTEKQVDAVKEIIENNLSDSDTKSMVAKAKKTSIEEAAREVVKAKVARKQEHYALKKIGKTEFRVRCSACAETHVYIMTHEPGGKHSIVEKDADSAFYSQTKLKKGGTTRANKR